METLRDKAYYVFGFLSALLDTEDYATIINFDKLIVRCLDVMFMYHINHDNVEREKRYNEHIDAQSRQVFNTMAETGSFCNPIKIKMEDD